LRNETCDYLGFPIAPTVEYPSQMTPEALAERFFAAQEIAREAGQLASGYIDDPERLNVELKGPQDFVSAADRAVEQLIIDRLSARFPADAFMGEESHTLRDVGADALWVIDPIDGTANFVRGLSEWVVSIGLLVAGVPTIGVIYHAAPDTLYAALRDEGATRNGAAMTVSARTTLVGSLVGLESSFRGGPAAHVGMMRALFAQGGEYRRSGSAALGLALVADGRLDAFAEIHLNAWDVAAGIVLVNEAGGWTNDFFAGNGLRAGGPLIAACPGVRQAFLRIVESASE
jgi:myo-inositol-1(or 4)-monophosphatase